VAIPVGTVSSVTIDEPNGLLIQPGDAAPLTLALSRLLLNEALRNQILSAGLRTIEEQYSLAAGCRKWRLSTTACSPESTRQAAGRQFLSRTC
jgi:glycosyltransferase involved in cell wall biosynthesis